MDIYYNHLVDFSCMNVICISQHRENNIIKWVSEYFYKAYPIKKTHEDLASVKFDRTHYKIIGNLYKQSESLGFNTLIVGLQGPGYLKHYFDFLAMHLASTILGSWIHEIKRYNSILAVKFKKENEPLISFAFHEIYRPVSIWGHYFHLNHLHMKQTINILLQTWQELSQSSITVEELHYALDAIIYGEIFNINSPEDRYLDIANEIIKGGMYRTLDERREDYMSISEDYIHENLEKYVIGKNPAIYVMGKSSTLPEYQDLLKLETQN